MLSSLILALAALTQVQSGDGLSQASIARAYNEFTPAICLVTYSAEVTNPNSGETSKRDSSALGLVVAPSGLVMAPGRSGQEVRTRTECRDAACAPGHPVMPALAGITNQKSTSTQKRYQY